MCFPTSPSQFCHLPLFTFLFVYFSLQSFYLSRPIFNYPSDIEMITISLYIFRKHPHCSTSNCTNPWCHVFCHISPPFSLVSLSFHLNLVLSAGLISWDDRWKGPFFLHSHRDTRNTELMKEWWYLITFQRIAPASEPIPKPLLNTHKWMANGCTSS